MIFEPSRGSAQCWQRQVLPEGPRSVREEPENKGGCSDKLLLPKLWDIPYSLCQLRSFNIESGSIWPSPWRACAPSSRSAERWAMSSRHRSWTPALLPCFVTLVLCAILPGHAWMCCLPQVFVQHLACFHPYGLGRKLPLLSTLHHVNDWRICETYLTPPLQGHVFSQIRSADHCCGPRAEQPMRPHSVRSLKALAQRSNLCFTQL